MQITQVDLLRHGAVATPHLFCAPASEPLSSEGWSQLQHATEMGQWDVVITSPFRRCHDFAHMIKKRLGCEFVIEPRFQEMNFGDWVGLTQKELWQQDAKQLQKLWKQPRSFIAPNGESMDEFRTRVQAAWGDLIDVYQGQRVLLLTHGGVIRVLLAHNLDILYLKTLRFNVLHAHFTRFHVYEDDECSLVSHGVERV